MSSGSDFEQFLRAARDGNERSPSPADAERVHAALGSRVVWRRPLRGAVAVAVATAASSAAASTTGSTSGASAAAELASTRWPWLLKALGIMAVPVVGISFFVAYSTGTPTTARTTMPRSAENVPPFASATAAPLLQTRPSDSADPLPTLAGPGELPDAKTDRAVQPSPSQLARAGEGTLDAELALLAQVSAALQSARPAHALALVEDHERRFSRPVLVPEFAAQRVIALAALGRQAESCERSAVFLATYPRSPLAPQVRSSCTDPTLRR